MATNRKNESVGVRFGPAVKALVLCLFIGGSGVGYVSQKNQLHILGAQFKEREMKRDKLVRENEARGRVLDALQSHAELEARVKQMNLGLVAPQPDQIIRLTDRLPPVTQRTQNRLYVGQTAQTKLRP